MKITYREKETDPAHPIMHGRSPMAKKFNKREAEIWSEGRAQKFDFEHVATILLEILIDDYDKRNKKQKKII